MGAAIETTGLSKHWGDVHAVDDLTISVRQGECYAFLGRNGAGKSTTARLLLDFIRPTAGSCQVLGGTGADPAVRARIGYLPGDLNLARTMTGWDAFDYFGSMGTPASKADITELVDRFGLDPGRPVHELSTGNRRKVGLVLAFMHHPELLILDEPTSGLDPVLQEVFRDLLAERKADGATIWITSHVMAEVERVADRVGLIDEGHLAQELTMADLRHQTAARLVFSFTDLPDPAVFEALPSVTGVTVADGDLVVALGGPVAEVLRVAADHDVQAVRSERRDLDDIFVELYSKGDR